MTTRPESDLRAIEISRRVPVRPGALSSLTAAAAFGAAVLAISAVSAPPAQAQAGSAATRLPPALRTVPASTAPIFSRAAAMLQVARARQNTAPAAAQQNYVLAAKSLEPVVSIGGLLPAGNGGGSTTILNGGIAPSEALPAGFSLADVTADGRALRFAADDISADQSKLMTRAAAAYETGARYFLAAVEQDSGWRTALNRPSTTSQRTASAGTSQAASSSLPAAPRTSGKPVTVKIYGSHQDQVQARQQGMQSLRNAYNPSGDSAAAAAAGGDQTGGEATASETSQAYQQALAAQQGALAAYQQILAQQTYLNALGWNSWVPFGGASYYGGIPLYNGPIGAPVGMPLYNGPVYGVGGFYGAPGYGGGFFGAPPLFGGGGFFP